VNGVKASYRDFGVKFDASPDINRPYCCGNMVFEPILPAPKVLDKYGITKSEYRHICTLLRECVSFGACRLCG
jgi:hypothetical protein